MSVLKTFLLDLPVLPSNLAAANSLLPVQPRVASKQVRTLVGSFSLCFMCPNIDPQMQYIKLVKKQMEQIEMFVKVCSQ